MLYYIHLAHAQLQECGIKLRAEICRVFIISSLDPAVSCSSEGFPTYSCTRQAVDRHKTHYAMALSLLLQRDKHIVEWEYVARTLNHHFTSLQLESNLMDITTKRMQPDGKKEASDKKG